MQTREQTRIHKYTQIDNLNFQIIFDARRIISGTFSNLLFQCFNKLEEVIYINKSTATPF